MIYFVYTILFNLLIPSINVGKFKVNVSFPLNAIYLSDYEAPLNNTMVFKGLVCFVEELNKMLFVPHLLRHFFNSLLIIWYFCPHFKLT